MASLDTIIISYRGNDFSTAIIPDVFNCDNQKILIGSHSLNAALYDDEKGYADEEARAIDEQLYAYIDDEYFSLGLEKFIENVKILLD